MVPLARGRRCMLPAASAARVCETSARRSDSARRQHCHAQAPRRRRDCLCVPPSWRERRGAGGAGGGRRLGTGSLHLGYAHLTSSRTSKGPRSQRAVTYGRRARDLRYQLAPSLAFSSDASRARDRGRGCGYASARCDPTARPTRWRQDHIVTSHRSRAWRGCHFVRPALVRGCPQRPTRPDAPACRRPVICI